MIIPLVLCNVVLSEKEKEQFYRFFIFLKEKEYNRTCYSLNLRSGIFGFYYLKEEIHIWLEYFQVSYSIFPKVIKDEIFFRLYSEWNIEIPDERMAMLFKLTWL
jgi:hypothetical protein